jgi:hypothetical protein
MTAGIFLFQTSENKEKPVHYNITCVFDKKPFYLTTELIIFNLGLEDNELRSPLSVLELIFD